MTRPRFLIVEIMLVIASAGLALGGATRRVRFLDRLDQGDEMIIAAFLILFGLVYRRFRVVVRCARYAELARRIAPAPKPFARPRVDHSAFLESRAYRYVSTPRPLTRSRP